MTITKQKVIANKKYKNQSFPDIAIFQGDGSQAPAVSQ